MTEFPIWQDGTEYRNVYYVDQQHPGAADDNPGTEEAPFLTIQAAAEIVGPAEKVLDHLRAKPAPSPPPAALSHPPQASHHSRTDHTSRLTRSMVRKAEHPNLTDYRFIITTA